jgi:TldD protein
MDSALLEKILYRAEDLGCKFADIRYQRRESEIIQVDNGTLQSYSSDTFSGIGVRVVYGGSIGFASNCDTSERSLNKTLEFAVKSARAQISGEEEPFSTIPLTKADVSLKMKSKPLDVSPEEKVSLAVDANKAAFIDDSIKTSYTRIGFIHNFKHFMSLDGTEIKVRIPLIGLGHQSVASRNGVKEVVSDSISRCSGWELLEETDWNMFTEELSRHAMKAVAAKSAPSGTFPVIVHHEVIGLVLHEALGHACEGDAVISNASILRDKRGKRIADEQVTVNDEGIIDGGYYHPYDDEGVEKGRTVVIKEGVLKTFLTDRKNAKKLGVDSTGNGRLQDFENFPIVRQTNFYMDAGDYSLDELIEGIDYGIYIKGKGGKGGQVDPSGTFTFGVGPSIIIRNGEPEELVRGVVISGNILDTMESIDAVGKDFKVKTSVFGGCGKGGQLVKTGMGGPTVRAQKMIVGGRA